MTGVQTCALPISGRLSRWKGQDDFVEALGRIAALPWLAVLVGGSRGSGKYERDLKSRVEELGLGGRIVFLPATDEMALHFAAADLVVYPASRPEGFGRIGVEAQAMGRPIVATGHGGSLETIRDGETGWLVPPKDPERLATAIADALSDRQRLARMGAAARAWVERAFPIERMCGGELAVYLDTLDAARGAAP